MAKTKKNKDTSVDVSENAFAMEQAIGGMVPPNAKDVEMKILGAIMLDNEILADCYEILKPEMFYSPANGIIFDAMLKLEQKSSPIDIVTVKEYLKNLGKLDSVGDVDYLMHIMDSVTTSANAVFHCNLVKEPWIHRRLIHTGAVLSDKAQDPLNDAYMLLDEAETTIMEISGSLTKKKEVNVRDEIDPIMAILEEARSNKNKMIDGIPFGYDELDEKTGGAHDGELIIIAGRPSHGKTAFAMNIATNMALNSEKKIAVFSLEMTYKELIYRLIASVCKVGGKKLKLGKLSAELWEKVVKNVEKLKKDIYIDDSPSLSILEIRAKARKMKAEHNIDAIVVDYLQLVKGQDNPERRDLEVAYVSRGLKALAKELQLPVIACAQLGRDVEKRANKKAQLSDLRESGSIEQDADLIIFVNRPIIGMKIERNAADFDEMTRKAIIDIGKQRNGPIGECYDIEFIDEWATFERKIHHPNFNELNNNNDGSDQPF